MLTRHPAKDGLVELLWMLKVFAPAFLAFGVSTLSGGGAGMMLIPVLANVLPTTQIPGALSLGSGISSVSRMALFHRSICWPMVRWFVPCSLPMVWLGAWLLSRIDPLYVEIALGTVLLANLPLLLKRGPETLPVRRASVRMFALIGAAAGLLSGLMGAVGLLFNRFYLTQGLSKEQVIATRAANEIILHVVKIAIYAAFGLMTQATVIIGLMIGVAALAAGWAAKAWLPYLSESLFRRLGYGAMVASGVAMSGSAITSLMLRHDVAIDAQRSGKGFEGVLNWQQRVFSVEFKYDEGFEIERVIDWDDLPQGQRRAAELLAEGADRVVIEEVRGINRLSYELYVYRSGELSKFYL